MTQATQTIQKQLADLFEQARAGVRLKKATAPPQCVVETRGVRGAKLPKAEWLKSLTEDEVKAFADWSGMGFDPIREVQKIGIKRARFRGMKERWLNDAKLIEKALKRSAILDKEAYRGLSFASREDALKFAKKASSTTRPMKFNSLTSWSRDFDIAEDFARPEQRGFGVVLNTVNTRTGVDIAGVAKEYVGEAEVLFSKAARFKYVDQEWAGKVLHIFIEEI
ncbi:hypothetical protein LCGC14_0236340 [marine sediment metagenome]|uniref:ADP ribosyltransferase domain-containing protein n=1 Tax=marine sediment metagenome TaxID=412755 RepID=A0A0F9WU06_9ZZZZ